ncbi:MAG TPA: sigma-54-dependent Fis family transcriptional regulator [Deltaproteobacteria bacterium]|nr:sigma-54-dependent Fis family transcriptional regulator [Deltaproteobacteria bacterium]
MGKMMVDRLLRRGFEAVARQAGEEALALLLSEEFDVVVTDVRMPGMTGLDLCTRIVNHRPDLPVVVITAFGSLDTAIAAIRAGAHDFVHKPFEIEELILRIEGAARYRALHAELVRLRQTVADSEGWSELLGDSPPIWRLRELLAKVAASDASVLVSGETGTGKEVAARAIHAHSARRQAPFVVLDCSALPATLLESELFGHVRGAFTDARAERKGLFVQAAGGTLFLDEVGELPLDLQPKLLRALQERRVRPVGSDSEVAADVRVIAATNRDLEAAVDEGRFRPDLFYRLEVLHVALPPLRSRGRDVLLLAQHFVKRFAARSDKHVVGFSAPVAERLLAYTWPGNVRELMNCIERSVALTSYEQLVVDDLPERVRDFHEEHVLVTGSDPEELVPLEEVERRYVLRVLDASGGNKTIAARVLGLDRKTLHRKLERWAQGP